eukprot:TRINITY_DN16043_c0_g6_i1.p1 TRINITY_DN16043_c0_g6~~TRINITY_DN16043_c0_g6_i1.p1  ORF type:complete len:252 (+),score=98.89 TRINITY_DN16043_c0_g6_i1:114-758(+)
MEVAGAEWELGAKPGDKETGDLWGEWLHMKWEQVWGFLPNLQLADGTRVGSELAILQYLARKYPVLAGATDEDFVKSQDLLHQAEELWTKLATKASTVMQEKPKADFDAFVNGDDKNTHCSSQGLQVYLWQFDEFFAKRGGTAGGFSIGEVKLFAVLAVLETVVSGAVKADKFPHLKAFYDRVAADPRVQSVLKGAAKNMTKPFGLYLVAPKDQ